MKQKKLFKTVVATAMAFAMTVSLSSGMTVMAAEKNPVVEAAEQYGIETQSNAGTEDAKYQEPVCITELDALENNEFCKRTEKFELDSANIETIALPMADTTVVAGTVSDYLTETEDALIYNISLPAGVYLQAQLTIPANASLDYDLYLLDAEGNILTGSDYYTYINGTSGTLPEAFGYITSGDTATYYLYVLSSAGGSVTEAFTLDYSISTACDNLEIDENVREALAFTFGTDGAYLNSRNLSSPIDNDWYVVTIPESRIYNKLSITATTQSVNSCSVEVYQNVSSSGYQMKKVGSGSNVSVSTGTYYVRVSNAKSMEDFDDLDIQAYTLTITPILTANSITITSMSGTEGSKYVTYSGYGKYFRTSKGTVTVTGYATVKDTTTNVTYYVTNTPVTIMYYNPGWEDNNTPSNAYVYGYGNTDSTGKYTATVSLPNAIGSLMADSGVSYHYFDLCAIYAYLSDNTSVITYEPIYHFAYSIYHSF